MRWRLGLMCITGLVSMLTMVGSAQALNLNRLLAPPRACPGPQLDANASMSSQENTMRCMVNYARKHAHRPALANTGRLDDSASEKASDILRCQQFSHYACGRSFLYWFQQLGFLRSGGSSSCWVAGENIAWGSQDYGTVRAIMNAWLHSPEHLANILDRQYAQFGVGLDEGDLNGYSGASVWVTHFGTHC